MGFIATIDSIVYLTETLLTSDSGVNGVRLKYLLTHKFSQDHVEMFFSTIRRRGGWTNNPTALQFACAYRAILGRVGAVPSPNGNITICDTSADIIMSGREWSLPQHSDSCDSTADVHVSLPVLSEVVDNVCVYIGGFVVRRLLSKVQCVECRELLTGIAATPDCALLILKDNGGLIKPSQVVITVIQRAEKHIRVLVSATSPVYSISQLGLKLESTILASIDPITVFGNTPHGLESAEAIDNHIFSLVRLIVRAYLDIRKFHVLKTWNIKQQGRVIRQTLTKTVLFKNQ